MAFKNPFATSNKRNFSEPEGKSKGILDDFAVRKDIQTLSGKIENTPVNNDDIVNKLYVDGQIAILSGSISVLSGSYVRKVGDVMTGTLSGTTMYLSSPPYYLSGTVVVDSDKLDGQHGTYYEISGASVGKYVMKTGDTMTGTLSGTKIYLTGATGIYATGDGNILGSLFMGGTGKNLYLYTNNIYFTGGGLCAWNGSELEQTINFSNGTGAGTARANLKQAKLTGKLEGNAQSITELSGIHTTGVISGASLNLTGMAKAAAADITNTISGTNLVIQTISGADVCGITQTDSVRSLGFELRGIAGTALVSTSNYPFCIFRNGTQALTITTKDDVVFLHSLGADGMLAAGQISGAGLHAEDGTTEAAKTFIKALKLSGGVLFYQADAFEIKDGIVLNITNNDAWNQVAGS